MSICKLTFNIRENNKKWKNNSMDSIKIKIIVNILKILYKFLVSFIYIYIYIYMVSPKNKYTDIFYKRVNFFLMQNAKILSFPVEHYSVKIDIIRY